MDNLAVTAPQLAALLLVTLAAVFDLSLHKIPNRLTYPSWVLGFALAAWLSGLAGLGNAALGFAAGFIPMLAMFLGGTIGGGDVKLMGGVGALLGFPEALNALITSILVGGVFAALILLWQGRLWGILHYALSTAWSKVNPFHVPVDKPAQVKDAFPFGIAIALGTYLTVLTSALGYRTPAQLLG